MMLTTYEQFKEEIDHLGFLFFSQAERGIVSLESLTPPYIWHTGDARTDPWRWKNAAAGDKHCAYGALLGKKLGFVSRELYPCFQALKHKEQAINEAWEYGEVPEEEYRLWQLFLERGILRTDEIHAILRGDGMGTSRGDNALRGLQSRFLVALCGSTRKQNRKGEEYGWSINVYQLAEDWAEGFGPLPGIDEALERIMAYANRQNPKLSEMQWRRLLGIDAINRLDSVQAGV